MTQLTTDAAIKRFGENEERVDIFVNLNGSYSTNEQPPRQVETLPSLMQRLKERYLTAIYRGNWATTTAYAVNDAVKESGVVYLCAEAHTSGTFATDLAAGKWGIAQGVTPTELAAEGGAALVGGKQTFASAVLRFTSDRMNERISVKDFGVTSSGDQYQKYQNAANEVSAVGGGIIKIPFGMNSIIDGILNVPDNVLFEYEGGFIGHISPNNIVNRGGKLTLPSGAKITLNNASGLKGLVVVRDGISFLSGSTDIANWSANGDAIVLNNGTTDAVIDDCGIFGFAQAVRSVAGATNVSRTRLNRLQIDCVNGVFLEYAYDIPYINEIHCWPFCSVSAPGEPLGAHLLRSGTAFRFGEVDDWLKIQNCFNYGYYLGFHIAGGNNVTLVSCGSDYVSDQVNDGSIGFLIDGNSREATLLACQAAARHFGFYINTPASNGSHSLNGCSSWECDSNHIVLEQGRAIIQGHRFRGGASSNGVYVHQNFDRATIIGNDFKDLNVGILMVNNGTKVYERFNTYSGVTTKRWPSGYRAIVNSADPLPLDGESEAYEVLGTTNFGTIDNPADFTGKTVILKFTGNISVYDGGNIKMKDNTVFAASADDTLMLYSDGQYFFEVARSTN